MSISVIENQKKIFKTEGFVRNVYIGFALVLLGISAIIILLLEMKG